MTAGERTVDWSCDQCGMDFSQHGPGDLAGPTREFDRRWRDLTGEVDDALLRERPDPSTWSAIEYGGHIRDVLDWMAMALTRTREEDHPDIDFFSPDQRAREEQYADLDDDEVTDAIRGVSARLADLLDDVGDDEWSRVAHYAWGDRDLLDMARNAVHEGVHHLWDVERVLDEVR